MRLWQLPKSQPGVPPPQLDVHLTREDGFTVARLAGEPLGNFGGALADRLGDARVRNPDDEASVVLHLRRDVPYGDAVKAYESAKSAGFARVFFATSEAR
jgi:biopolymer transport protein ExbD